MDPFEEALRIEREMRDTALRLEEEERRLEEESRAVGERMRRARSLANDPAGTIDGLPAKGPLRP